MKEKRYRKWYNKLGYGFGDIAGNMIYAFVMIYLTDTVGLSAGIVGTLIMFSMGTSIVVSYITAGLVDWFGGGAAGWRIAAVPAGVSGSDRKGSGKPSHPAG